MQRLRLFKFFFPRSSASTHKVQKIRIICFIVLSSLLICSLLGEIGAFTLSSRSWKWPTPVPVSYWAKKDTSHYGILQNTLYYHNEDSHQYMLRAPESAPGETKNYRHDKISKNDGSELRIMLISDPHIMCTHNKYVCMCVASSFISTYLLFVLLSLIGYSHDR